jgi:hypothetical protein
MAMIEGVTFFLMGDHCTGLSWGVPVGSREWDDLVADVDRTTRRLVMERNPIPHLDATVHHLAQAAWDNLLVFERDPQHQGFERILQAFIHLIARSLGSTEITVRLDDWGTVEAVEVA